MTDWALAVSGLIGVIVGAAVTEFRHWREWRERYKVMTFEKRLVTHQEAFNLCCELGDALDRDNLDDIGTVAVEMRKWWRSHCLFLDRTSNRDFVCLANDAYRMAEESDMGLGSKCWKLLAQATRTIVQGIGGEHLPEITRIGGTGKGKDTKEGPA